MPVLRILLGTVGFGGLLIWPTLCVLTGQLPAFHIGAPPSPGFSQIDVSLYIGAPVLACAYYILVSVATPRRLIAFAGVALHLGLIAAILLAMSNPDGGLIAVLVFGGALSLLYESQSFSRRAA